MKRTICHSLLLAIAVLLLARATPVAAQGPARVYVEPAAPVLQAGETATLVIKVEGAADLFGVELHLFYDPAVVEILDGDGSREGIQLVQGSWLDLEAGFTVANSADNLLGELDYAFTLLAPAESVSGDGIVVSFDVRALADGSSPLTLSAILATDEGLSLPVTVESGQIVVGDGAGALPTPAPPANPTPTLGPGEQQPTEQPKTGEPTVTRDTQPVTPAASQAIGEPDSSPQPETPIVPEATGSEATGSESAGEATAGPEDVPAANDGTDAAVVALPVVAQDLQEGGEGPTPAAGQPVSPGSIEADESMDSGNDSLLVTGGLILFLFLLIAIVIFFGRRLLSRN